MMANQLKFTSEESDKWFRFVMKQWKPRHDTVILIPCASTKPFHRSVTHRNFLRYLWQAWLKDRIDLVIVSEPLTIVPAEYDYPEPIYPLYDYPPDLIKKENDFSRLERSIWRYRLTLFMRLIGSRKCFFILYPYHRYIIGDILEKFCVSGIYVERPYLTKGMSLLNSLISKTQYMPNNGFLYVNSRIKFLPVEIPSPALVKS